MIFCTQSFDFIYNNIKNIIIDETEAKSRIYHCI